MCRFAVFADLHFGPTRFLNGAPQKLAAFAEQFLFDFVETVQSSNEYLGVIQLGDLIQSANPELDTNNLNSALHLLKPLPIPVYHVLGNHDCANVSPLEYGSHFIRLPLYNSITVANALQLIVLDSSSAEAEFGKPYISSEQMLWLEGELKQTNLPTLVAVHHSLADQELADNPWFSTSPEQCLIANRVEVRELLRKSGKVIAVINGHLHWNQLTRHDEIPYLTLQAACENFRGSGKPTMSWSEITITRDRFSLFVHGLDTFSFEYRFRHGERGRASECVLRKSA